MDTTSIAQATRSPLRSSRSSASRAPIPAATEPSEPDLEWPQQCVPARAEKEDQDAAEER